MKSKNIPADIRSKTTKEAQIEIKEIISSLENSEKSLKDSIDKYNRMIHLNNYIQEKFREKSKEISNSNNPKKIL
tara:strand:+ start:140 stop:364 length:225 start_codon:yes stop_codon:yes gene_type:complete